MSKSTPKAPNYEAAAERQAQASREVTEQQTWANRPDQVTPFGTQSWANQQQWDPATQQYLNRWTQTTELTPESQRALDAQLGLTAGRSELGASLMPRLQQEYGTPVDWNQFREGGESVQAGNLDSSGRYYDEAGDAVYNQWAERALPEQARSEEALRTRLYNMGFKEGDDGFDDEMKKLRQSQSDAQRQAAFQATVTAGGEAQRMLGMDQAAGGQNFQQQMASSQYDTQLRQQDIAEELQRRGFSLNEVQALLTGQQVGMPSMPGFNTAAASQPVQALQAAQMTGQAELDRYNARQQAMQGMMSGIGDLAGGFMPGPKVG